jgi:MFS family permease
VRLAFWFNIASAVGASIVSGSVFLSSYVFFLEGAGNGNLDVGLVSATAGVTMVVLAVPAGILTDRLPRASVLRASGVAGLLSSAALFAALVLPAPRAAMALLYAASALSGAYSALSGPALSSILADSVASGQRTKIYALQYAATLAAGAAGPLLGIALLAWLGDVWATPQLRAVMLAGNCINALACGFAFLFDDKASLGAESEGALASPPHGRAGGGGGSGGGGGGGGSSPGGAGGRAAVGDRTAAGDGDGLSASLLVREAEGAASAQTAEKASALKLASLSGPASAAAAAATAAETAAEAAADDRRRARRNLGHQTLPLGCCTLRVRHVPYIIFASDFTIAVGAGMTVQFFALFFAHDEGLSPIAVASIWVGCPLLIAATSAAAVPLARRIGRAVTAVACDAVGTLCILGLGLGAALPPWAVIAVYLVRTAAMNASYPVQRAILMDLVAKKQRGRWNSLENLTAFTWTGSAALGGVLVDRFGYRFTFLITAAIYSLATCILCMLVPLTWGEVSDDDAGEEGAGEAGAEGEGGGGSGVGGSAEAKP